MKLRHILFLAALTCGASAMAQAERGRVGVNATAPTERLHVNGTARFQSLPKAGEGVTTSAAGQYDQTKANHFDPKRVVVANAQGVFGSMPGAWPLFFYLPGYIMPTDVSAPEYDGTMFTIDLHKIYRERFQPSLAAVTPPATASPSSTALPVEQVSDLGFFVTYYDNTVVKDVTVDDTGILTYKLVNVPAVVTDKTYMNIVFKRL